jgi:hypothetical protein
MTEADFQVLLIAASFMATRFGQNYVVNTLPFSFRYHVLLNQSYDGHATPDEILYPEDKGREMTCLSERAAVAILFRDGRCPEWIDVHVEAAGSDFTQLQLRCCGRFTNDRKMMYYEQRTDRRSRFLPCD